MPRKSNTTTSNATDEKNYSLRPQEVDIEKIFFKGRVPDKKAAQQMCWPKYEYPDKTVASPVIISGDIKIFRGGIPKYSESDRYYSDRDSWKRAWFYLPHDPSNPASVELFNSIKQIDDYMHREINELKNVNNVLTYNNSKGESRKFKGYTYRRMISTAKKPKTLDLDDDDDDENNTKNTRQFIPYERIKVKLSTVYDEKLGPNDNKEINTQVYLKDNEEPEEVTTVSDVERYLTWNCTARFALMPNKVWIQMSDEQNCGISIKCIQMCIYDQPEYNKQQNLSSRINKRLFAKRDMTVNTALSNNTKNNSSDSDSDSNSDSNSDSDSDGGDDSVNDSGDNSDSEPETDDEPQVKVKSKTSRTNNLQKSIQ